MPRVFFDHQKFSTQKYGGISRYFANIIKGIEDRSEFDYLLGVMLSDNHYLKSEGFTTKNVLTSKFLGSPFAKKSYLINELYCKYLLEKNDFDIFHPTYYDPYFISKLKKPLVVTIHDMIQERLPQYFWSEDPITQEKRLSIERADKIIAISETTKKDLIKYSNVDIDKIQVIYHGIDLDKVVETQAVNDLPEEFLLFVGDRGGYKNFYLFIVAYASLMHKYPTLQVVLTGGGQLGVAESEFLKRSKLSNRIRHINVSDEQLNYLYQAATLFVYPSMHEGFGLPILEAFKNKCALVLSDTDCFREIAQDAAFYFDSNDAKSLANLLDQLLSSESLRTSLLNKGEMRMKDFALEKSLNETMALYNSMI